MGVMTSLATGAAAFVGVFALQTASRVVAEEIKDWLPLLSERLLTLAVKRLPEVERGRYRAEWIADLNEYPGKLTQMLRAGGFCFAAVRIRAGSPSSITIKSELRVRLKYIFAVPRLRRMFWKGVSFQACFAAFQIWGLLHFHLSFLSNLLYCILNIVASFFVGKWLTRNESRRSISKE